MRATSGVCAFKPRHTFATSSPTVLSRVLTWTYRAFISPTDIKVAQLRPTTCTGLHELSSPWRKSFDVFPFSKPHLGELYMLPNCTLPRIPISVTLSSQTCSGYSEGGVTAPLSSFCTKPSTTTNMDVCVLSQLAINQNYRVQFGHDGNSFAGALSNHVSRCKGSEIVEFR